MSADIQSAEQQFTDLQQLVVQEQYLEAAEAVSRFQQQLQQLFSTVTGQDQAEQKRLQQLAENFLDMLATLNKQQLEIKDSISQIAALKSGNKISKTYQID
ncbi:MAG: hypothetical protein CML20_09250 [Rheinheimera sp.]|uniref:hypothetical protein n=1 Tax=Arsukibacterium sp. UBA3155 TaxID=1946058 RepID=UPI000C8DDB7D|nr:hypothetical protein [Arsukibacterium sp. UBA3155]MAD74959.1 hypothetical protein [Rheinheimera sp.]|tara:strand:- start:201322 stop:201624 length:303 start_codon:yes stop_codon:yes gene_type:complete